MRPTPALTVSKVGLPVNSVSRNQIWPDVGGMTELMRFSVVVLAGAVRADEGVDFALLHVNGEVIDRNKALEALDEMLNS